MTDTSFAPFNDDFDTNPDKQYIVGPYSTFDPQLANIARKIDEAAIGPDNIKCKTLKSIFTRRVLWPMYSTQIVRHTAKLISITKVMMYNKYMADIFLDIISQREIRHIIKNWKSLNARRRVSFGQTLINGMIDAVNAQGFKIPPVHVNRSNRKYHAAGCCEITTYNKADIKIRPTFIPVDWFCYTVFHEFIHLVDLTDSNHGPLGAQITHVFLPLKFNDPYYNPLERNASVMKHYIMSKVNEIKKIDYNTTVAKIDAYTISEAMFLSRYGR